MEAEALLSVLAVTLALVGKSQSHTGCGELTNCLIFSADQFLCI